MIERIQNAAKSNKTMARRHWEAQVKAWGESHVLPWAEFRTRWGELHGIHPPERRPCLESKAWNRNETLSR